MKNKYLVTALVTVLGLLCALQLVSAQLRQEPCRHLPGGTGKVKFTLELQMMMMGMIRMYAHLLREISECHEKNAKEREGMENKWKQEKFFLFLTAAKNLQEKKVKEKLLKDHYVGYYL